MICGSVIDVIGETPLVALDRIIADLGLEGRLLAKLDNLLPGYSKKDRAARAIIEAARASGDLAPGQTVVELTSGYMGTGLAIVCAVLPSFRRGDERRQLARTRPADAGAGRGGHHRTAGKRL